MRSVQCLFILSVLVLFHISGCFSASLTKGSGKSSEQLSRVRRQLGSWNVIRPWGVRVPCEYRQCWVHDDCCRGYVCFGIDDEWMNDGEPSECQPIQSPLLL